MTAATVRAFHDGVGASPAVGTPMAGDLEVPRPLRLILTAGWNLAESAGFPVAAYAVAAWVSGRNAGLIAGLVAIWLIQLVSDALGCLGGAHWVPPGCLRWW